MTRYIGILLLLVTSVTFVWSGCVSAGPGEEPPELPPNPPGCDRVVEEHRENPELPVDLPPKPVRMPVLFCRACLGQPITVTYLVDESGVPDHRTIEMKGLRPEEDRVSIRRNALQARFQPARVGECRVPAPFLVTINRRRSPAEVREVPFMPDGAATKGWEQEAN